MTFNARPHLVFAFCILANAGLAQPVTVMLPSVADNTLYEALLGDLSNGAGARMFAGRAGNGGLRRALMRFDVGAIPPNALIQSATLDLTMDQTSAGAEVVTVHRLLQGFGEGTSVATQGQSGGAPATANDATWLHRFYPATTWTNAGSDFVGVSSTSATVGSPGNYTWSSTPTMIADVQAWVSGISANDGWLLRGPENVGTTAKRFVTREDLNAATWPRLTITYLLPAPAVTSTGLGCSGTNPLPFTLSAGGTPPLPVLGNSTFRLDLTNGPPNALAALYLAYGLASTPLSLSSACNLYLDFASFELLILSGASPILPLFLSPAGSLSFPIPIPNDQLLIGQTITVQAAATDPAIPTLNFITSNALAVSF